MMKSPGHEIKVKLLVLPASLSKVTHLAHLMMKV